MDGKKIKNVTLEVLDFALSIPEALFSSFERKSLNDIFKEAAEERLLTVSNISKLFQNLKREGYIEVLSSEGCESIRFTNKAKLAVVDRLSDRSQKDDKYYLVSFDIPERLRAHRNRFRRVLKRLGCRQIQKSLWVSNRKIGEYVELAADEYKIREYVVYGVIENISIARKIEEMFKNTKIS